VGFGVGIIILLEFRKIVDIIAEYSCKRPVDNRPDRGADWGYTVTRIFETERSDYEYHSNSTSRWKTKKNKAFKILESTHPSEQK